MNTLQIGILVGSTRRGSYSRSIANALADLLPKGMLPTFLEIGSLPLYNQDLDEGDSLPAEWVSFRKAVGEMDGFLFVTPEYNRGVPPVLKNALDVASRPYGKNAWNGKPGAVISVSPGRAGGFGANHQLRQSFVFLNIFAMQQPEAYISGVDRLVDASGNVTDPSTKDFLQTVASAYAQWVNRFVPTAP